MDTFSWNKAAQTFNFKCGMNLAAAAPMAVCTVDGDSHVPASALLELASAAINILANDSFHKERLIIDAVLSTMHIPPGSTLIVSMDGPSGNTLVVHPSGPVSTTMLSCANSAVLEDICSSSNHSGHRREATSPVVFGLSSMEAWTPVCTAFLEVEPNAYFLPLSACESSAALHQLYNQATDGSVAASVMALRLPNAQGDGVSRRIASLAVDCSPSSVGLFHSKVDEIEKGFGIKPSTHFQRIGLKHVSSLRHAPDHAFNVVLRRVELQSMPILSPRKWMVLSLASAEFSDICAPHAGDALVPLCVQWQHPESSRILGKELVISTSAHMHWILKGAAVDHALVIGRSAQRAEGKYRSSEAAAAYDESLGWAHSAFELSAAPCKVSTITPGLHDGNGCTDDVAGALAIATARTHFMEDRDRAGVAIDFARNEGRLSAQQLHWLIEHSGESCVSVRHGELYIERLQLHVPVPRRRQVAALNNTKHQMCCVIMGGTKGLGLRLAHQFAEAGFQQLVITSRRGTLEAEDEEKFAKHGARVIVKACDSADPEDCAALATWLREHMPAVQIFVHAAGVLRFDLLPDMSLESFSACVMPKVVGVNSLLNASLPFESSMFFSSTSAVWSQPGAAHYAAANACLDQTARIWQDAGIPGTSINFGPFGDNGMAAGLG